MTMHDVGLHLTEQLPESNRIISYFHFSTLSHPFSQKRYVALNETVGFRINMQDFHELFSLCFYCVTNFVVADRPKRFFQNIW